MSEPINDLLSQAEEIFSSGKGTKAELAKYLGKPVMRVYEWFNGSRFPNGNTTLLIESWVKEKKSDDLIQEAYKRYFKVKRPVFLPPQTHINE